VFRKNWRNRQFWSWWWSSQVPRAAQAAVGLVAFTLIVGAGWFAADRLASAKASTAGNVITYTTTTQRVVTLRTHPKASRVVGVRTVSQTVHDQQPTTAIAYRTVTQSLAGRPVTVVETRTRTATKVVPDVRTVTNRLTTTATQTETQTQVQTSTVTLVQTETRTETETRTVTRNRTVTVIVTVTAPK
jgi:hypothetical protein